MRMRGEKAKDLNSVRYFSVLLLRAEPPIERIQSRHKIPMLSKDSQI